MWWYSRVRGFIYIAICLVLVFNSVLYADTIYLKNGNRVTGIITKEDEKSVEIKINIGATVTFSKADIANIERDGESEHARMEEAWQEAKLKKELEEVEQESFIEEQREKGLVEHEGEWVTPEKRERLQAKNIARYAHKRHTRFSYKKQKGRRSAFADRLLAKGKWFIKETEHFDIFYKDPSQAKIISDKAEYYFEKILYDLGYEDEIKWDKKCQVYIIESISQWKDFLKDIGFSAELVGGFVPNYQGREMYLCALSKAYLAVTFPHELTHLIFREISGKSTIPLWLNEGLANYEASVTSISNELLVKRIKHGSHILLGDLLRTTNYPEGKEMRELFYAQSEKLVEFLITQYGRKKFRKFCELIMKDKSFYDALLSIYADDFEDIEDFNIKLVEYIVQ